MTSVKSLSQRSFSTSGGFTLPELLSAVVITAILATLSAASWSSFIQGYELNAAQEKVYHAIRRAQQQAEQGHTTWQASFRELDGTVQWAIHNSTITPATAQWNSLAPSVQIDTSETTLARVEGVWRVQFNFKGNTNGQLGRITLVSHAGGKAKRCIIVSTLIGNIRIAREQSQPDQAGRYCY